MKNVVLLSMVVLMACVGGVYFATEPSPSPASSRIESVPDTQPFVAEPMAGQQCPADPNPCESGCSPVNCTDTDLGVSGCQLSGGGDFSCPKVGQTVVHRHCACQSSTGQFCLPVPPDDPVIGTDVLYCRP